MNLEIVEHGFVDLYLNSVTLEPAIFEEIRENQSSDTWLTKLRGMKEAG